MEQRKLQFSRHNIIRKIRDSEEYIIVNALAGQADILPAETAEKILAGETPQKKELIEKNYLVDPEEEKTQFTEAYLGFTESRNSSEVQIFFVPWYSCNFSCSYCYQSGYDNRKSPLSNEVIDAFFNYIENKFKDRPYYITIFGGEPLLPGSHYMEKLAYFLQKAGKTGIAVVSNGYELDSYLPLLKQANIREIQITLDGTAEIHNSRRPLAGGQGTFQRISDNIDLLLAENLPVNLRVVVDRQNIDNLPDLAGYAVKKGWTKNSAFKTQLGRNYELHYCQEENSRLFSRLEMYDYIYELIKKHPVIMDFHRPAYSVSRFLFDNGELPDPLFDSCPGCKTEWAFDYTGRIYSCTATVGKKGEELGTFYPETSEDTVKIEQWQDRDVLSIEKCRTCPAALICGGGCAAVAENQHGSITREDCRPAADLLSAGIALYFGEE